jgi:site-specific recombinase XerD
MKDVSLWLASEGLVGGDLRIEVIGRFVAARRCRRSNLRSVRALVPLLGFLRRVGAAPMPSEVAPVGPAELLVTRFVACLRTERGLAEATVASYCSQVSVFVKWRVGHYGCDWGSLTAGQVREFVLVRAVGQRRRSVQVGLSALRVLLRWMFAEGLVSAGLAEGLGPVSAPTVAALPKALTSDQVGDMLAVLAADSPARVRDEAIMVLLWRMGLRAGEVAALLLDDIDWRTGVILVRGKGNRHEQVPLPVDVGRSVAAYVEHGRPAGGAYRRVFLALDAPHRPIGAQAVSSVVCRVAANAGIGYPVHAHRLRHTTACQVLAAGGGLVEVGQLLRHASTSATAIYAKVDITALTVLARPWPVTGVR